MLQLVGVVLVKPIITCFMIVRNALNQGYPFVEAVAQALPVCDEILVGDGGSIEELMEEILAEARKEAKLRGFQVPLYPLTLREEPVEEHPRIMQQLLRDKENCSYYVREELYKMVRELR